MFPKRLVLFLVGVCLLTAGVARADIIILKSGEMFQTRRAWTENGRIHYYHNDQEVVVAESAVERLIRDTAPAESPAREDGRDRTDNRPASGVLLPELPPPEAAADHDDAGFLGVKWGRPVSSFDNLILVDTDPAYGGVQQFVRQGSPRRFGRAAVDNIFYGFWQEGLYTILIEVSNYLDYTTLKAEAFRRYGQGRQPVPDLERYRWQDRSTDRMLSFDDASDTGYLWMRSRAMHAKVSQRYPE